MKIFGTTGSRSFQFDRMVRALDEADFSSVVSDDVEVHVQIGSSTYIPKNVERIRFLSRDEFLDQIKCADIVVTHGGTGAIVSAISSGKKVVAVPRLASFSEAVDDHQVELVKQFEQMKLIRGCFDLSRIVEDVARAVSEEYRPYRSNTEAILKSIDEFIQLEVIKDGRRRAAQ